MDGQVVTVTNTSTIPCPYIGQIVNIGAVGKECCYTVIGFKGISQANVTINSVHDTCDDCCEPVVGNPGVFRSCCTPFNTVNFNYTGGSVGNIFTYDDGLGNIECYTLVGTGGIGGSVIITTTISDCTKCNNDFPCSGEPTPTPTPTNPPNQLFPP